MARYLWVQIHGIEYPDQIGVQVNTGTVVPLDNANVAIDEPGASYGGIGSNQGTLGVWITLDPALVTNGTNTITFSFLKTDGNSSEFRVLDFNFYDNSGTTEFNGAPILPESVFTHEDTTTWTPPFTDSANISAGLAAFQAEHTIVQSPLSPTGTITASCADCHTQDGHDLKYFNYSNNAIINRCVFHGLSVTQGQQIASYIRNLNYSAWGQPWNPPYQPTGTINFTTQPDRWAGGGGMGSVLDNDFDMLPILFNGASTWQAPDGITPQAINTNVDLNMRQLPISFHLLDWNHWLPRLHPKDSAYLAALGVSFVNSAMNHDYNGEGSGSSSTFNIRGDLATTGTTDIADGRIAHFFNAWNSDTFSGFVPLIKVPTSANDYTTNAAYSNLANLYGSGTAGYNAAVAARATTAYDVMLWKQVKEWDLLTGFTLPVNSAFPTSVTPNLQTMGIAFFTSTTVPTYNPGMTGRPEALTWMDGNTFNTLKGVNVTYRQGGNVNESNPAFEVEATFASSPVDFEYIINSWYYLQFVLNAGNRAYGDSTDPIDFGYARARLGGLQSTSIPTTAYPHGPHLAMQETAEIVKAMQQGDGTTAPAPGGTGGKQWHGLYFGSTSALTHTLGATTDWFTEWSSGTYTDPNTRLKEAHVIEAVTRTWFAKMQNIYYPSSLYTAAEYYNEVPVTTLNSTPTNPNDSNTIIYNVYNELPNIRKGMTGSTAGTGLPNQSAADVRACNRLANDIAEWARSIWPGSPLTNWVGHDEIAMNTDVYNGLVARWTFDEGTGTIASDWSDFEVNPGTLAGGSGALPTWVTTGKMGGALSFSPAGHIQWVTVPHVTPSSLDVGANFTVAAWVKIASATENRDEYIIDTKNGATNAATGYGFFYNPSKALLIAHCAGATIMSATLATPLDTDWHHLIMVVNGATGQFYVDGSAVTMTSSSTGTIVPSTNAANIGYDIDGQLDDVRIYNRALTATNPPDIGTLYGVTQ